MIEPSPEPVMTWRFLRFNAVRVSTGAVLVAAVSVAVFAWMPYQRELRIARKVEALGGRVHFGYFGPTWIPRSIQQIPLFLDRIDSIDLDGHDVPLDLISDLGTLEHLLILKLNNTQLTDEGLKHLNGLAHLYHLTLQQTQVTDKGLVHLKGLKNLGYLELNGTKTTRVGRAILRTPICTIMPVDPPDPPRIMDPEYYHRHRTPVYNTECQR